MNYSKVELDLWRQMDALDLVTRVDPTALYDICARRAFMEPERYPNGAVAALRAAMLHFRDCGYRGEALDKILESYLS